MNDLIGKTIAKRYRIETFLGKGGMAEVYKVWDQERSVYLAMKILHADLAEDKVFLRRFKREAQTLAKIQHPNIVRFYGMEQDEDLVYMLMEYVEGTTLRKEIFQSKTAFSMERILEVMKSVCAALYYAHKSGFVHCDVKPANIMIHKNGTIYVSDFGIARMTEAATVTMAGAGTPAYMSPEQIKGDVPTPQMDIYALGIVLFEMLTGGERPFTGENANTTGTTSEKVRWEQLRLAAPPPSKYKPSIPPSMDEIVLRCLDKSPVNRYLSAMDLYGDLITLGNVLVQPKSVTQPTNKLPLSVETPAPESLQYTAKYQEDDEKSKGTKNNRLIKISTNSRQTIIIVGLIVLGIGLIAILSSLLKSLPATATKTSTPIIFTSAPTLPVKNSISVFSQTGSIGILRSPDEQSQDLVNGIFTILKDSSVEIIQNGANINLSDGTSLYMSAGTVFIFTKIEDGTELMLEQGSIMAKLDIGTVPLSIKTRDGLVAQVSGSIMGVQNSLEPLGTFVDCYEGQCVISGGGISRLTLDDANRYLFYTAGNANPSDQTQRCEFWKNAISAEKIQGLGYCTEQQPIATYTPNVPVNAEATQRCEVWLRDHHNKKICP